MCRLEVRTRQAARAGNFVTEILERRWLLSAGQFDPTFGTGGVAEGALLPGQANAVALQADGKVVVGGTATAGYSNSSFGLARYQANGLLDRGFGNRGKVTTAFGDVWDEVDAIAVQADGGIVAAGTATDKPDDDTAPNHFLIARYLPNGTLDSGFGD